MSTKKTLSAMIKSMTYINGPSDQPDLQIIGPESSKVASTAIKLNEYNNMSDDSDSIGKDFNDEQKHNGNMTEIVVVENKAFDDQNDHISNNSDSASSNESGFGTVDDELDNENEQGPKSDEKKKDIVPSIIVYQPLQQKQGLFNEVTNNSSSSSSQQPDNIAKYPQQIKLPTLQVCLKKLLSTLF